MFLLIVVVVLFCRGCCMDVHVELASGLAWFHLSEVGITPEAYNHRERASPLTPASEAALCE